jgi:shikimate dehydrogenase
VITGKTRLFGVIADPIEHVRAPQVFNPVFAARGFDAVLVPCHVAPDGLAALMDGFRRIVNFGGFLVTVPHKLRAAELCDELGPAGRLIGSVNAVRRDPDGRLIGEMFDGKGFVAGLEQAGYDLRGKGVLLVGAGGAGRAIAFAVAEAGVRRLTIANRTARRAEELARAVLRATPGVGVLAGPADPAAGHDLVINATSLGLKPNDPLPIDADRLEPATAVAEIIMEPETTALLAAAQRRGCPVFYGRPMLACQVDLIADFIGVPRKARGASS